MFQCIALHRHTYYTYIPWHCDTSNDATIQTQDITYAECVTYKPLYCITFYHNYITLHSTSLTLRWIQYDTAGSTREKSTWHSSHTIYIMYITIILFTVRYVEHIYYLHWDIHWDIHLPLSFLLPLQSPTELHIQSVNCVNCMILHHAP